MTEMTDAEVFGAAGPQKEMSDEDVFGSQPLAPTAAEATPEAFMGRLRAGQALGRVLAAAGKGAVEGAGQGTPTGFEDDTLNQCLSVTTCSAP